MWRGESIVALLPGSQELEWAISHAVSVGRKVTPHSYLSSGHCGNPLGEGTHEYPSTGHCLISNSCGVVLSLIGSRRSAGRRGTPSSEYSHGSEFVRSTGALRKSPRPALRPHCVHLSVLNTDRTGPASVSVYIYI